MQLIAIFCYNLCMKQKWFKILFSGINTRLGYLVWVSWGGGVILQMVCAEKRLLGFQLCSLSKSSNPMVWSNILNSFINGFEGFHYGFQLEDDNSATISKYVFAALISSFLY